MHYIKLSRKTVGWLCPNQNGCCGHGVILRTCMLHMSTDCTTREKFRTMSKRYCNSLWTKGYPYVISKQYKHALHSMYLFGHQGPRLRISKSLDPTGKLKLHEKGKYHTVGKITIFVSLYFFSCSSHSNALKGMTVYIVQSI